MLDLSFAKTAVLIGAAVLIFGPDKVPHLIRDALRLARKVQAFAREGTEDLKAGLGPEFADISSRDLHPKVLLTKALNDTLPDVDTVRAEFKDAMNTARDIARVSPERAHGERHDLDGEPAPVPTDLEHGPPVAQLGAAGRA